MTQNPEVFIFNWHKRFSGVSSTVSSLLPLHGKKHSIAFVGDPLPGFALAQKTSAFPVTHLSINQALIASRKCLPNGRPRIWHLRRDHEMVLGLFARDTLKLPIRLVFTSAGKCRRSKFSRWLMSKMNAVICTSNDAASYVDNCTKIIPHGVSLDRFNVPSCKRTSWESSGLPGNYGIGVFGRVRPKKGIALFVDAMQKLLPKYPDFTAVIVGHCRPQHLNFKRKLQKQISANNLSERIIFVGEIPYEQIPLWYQRVLLTVACPSYESFGLTILEGMASGTAGLATRAGEFSNMIEDGVSGYVVDCDDVNALEHAAEKIISDPENALRMGRLARQRVENYFDVENEARDIEEVYDYVAKTARF